MEQKTREAVNHMTALRGETPFVINGHEVRRVSMESMAVLQLVGSPFAVAADKAVAGEKPERPAVGGMDTALMLWIHAEDPDKVQEIALDCVPGFTRPAYMAALKFVRGWSIKDAERALGYAMEEIDALQAASYDMAAPEPARNGKKND